MDSHKLAKYLRWGTYAISILPLIVFSQYMSPFHFPKVAIFRSLIEIMTALYIVLWLSDRSYGPKKNIILYSLSLFALVFGITSLTGYSVNQSLWGTLERMGGFWTFVHYWIYFIIITSVFRTRQEWVKLLYVFIWVGFLSALYGFGQKTAIDFFVGGPNRLRIFGTIGNAALFAGYELLNIFLGIALLSETSLSPGKKRFIKIAVATMSLAVLMTAVRGSVLALVIGFLVLAVLWGFRGGSVIWRKVSYGILIFVVAFGLLAGLIRNTDFGKSSGYVSRITDLSLNSFTVQTRLWAWQAGFDGWNESPRTVMLGYGPENFNIPFSINFNPKFYTGSGAETLFDRAHNMFVEILVTMGLIGIISYLLLLGSVFYLAWRIKEKGFSFAFIALLISYIVHNFFIFDTFTNFMVFFTVAGFIVFMNSDGDKPLVGRRVASSGLMKILKYGLLIVSLIFVYRINIVPTQANKSATNGIIYGANNRFSESAGYYRKSLGYPTIQGENEIRYKMAQSMFEQAGSRNINPEEIKADLIWGVQELDKSIKDSPYDYLPYLYASRLNLMLANGDPKSPYNEVAREYAQKALDIVPTFPRAHYEMGYVYMSQADYVLAEETFNRAIELNPDISVPYWYLALIKMETSSDREILAAVDRALAMGYGPNGSDYLRLSALYVRTGNINKVIWALEGAISADGSNPQYYASLAAAYAQVGRIDDAVAAARKAVSLDPSFESDARIFINSLGRKY